MAVPTSRGPNAAPGRSVDGWVVIVFALALLAQPMRAEEPLIIDDLLLRLRSGITEAAIVIEIRARGILTPLTAQDEQRLRKWGATDAFIQVLQARPSAPAAPATPTPPARQEAAALAPPLAANVPRFEATTAVVRIPVTVSDGRGRPVRGLLAGDFRVFDGNEARPIALFSDERKPLRVAILVDVSGSMEEKLDAVTDALKHLTEVLEPEDQVLVLSFNDRVRVALEFSAERRGISRVLEDLRAAGGTALNDALVEGLARLEGTPHESSAVVLVTDGVDTASGTSFRQALDAVRRAEVPVYSIGLGHRSGLFHLAGGHGGEADFDGRPLLELADFSGARAEILADAEHHHRGKVDRLKEAVEAIALSLRYRYLLGYAPPETDAADEWRAVRVEVGRPNLTVRARKGYYPRVGASHWRPRPPARIESGPARRRVP